MVVGLRVGTVGWVKRGSSAKESIVGSNGIVWLMAWLMKAWNGNGMRPRVVIMKVFSIVAVDQRLSSPRCLRTTITLHSSILWNILHNILRSIVWSILWNILRSILRSIVWSSSCRRRGRGKERENGSGNRLEQCLDQSIAIVFLLDAAAVGRRMGGDAIARTLIGRCLDAVDATAPRCRHCRHFFQKEKIMSLFFFFLKIITMVHGTHHKTHLQPQHATSPTHVPDSASPLKITYNHYCVLALPSAHAALHSLRSSPPTDLSTLRSALLAILQKMQVYSTAKTSSHGHAHGELGQVSKETILADFPHAAGDMDRVMLEICLKGEITSYKTKSSSPVMH